eukprot:6343695-Amphidinium_carterae.1
MSQITKTSGALNMPAKPWETIYSSFLAHACGTLGSKRNIPAQRLDLLPNYRECHKLEQSVLYIITIPLFLITGRSKIFLN